MHFLFVLLYSFVYRLICIVVILLFFFFVQAEDGIRDLVRSRGLGDVYKRQALMSALPTLRSIVKIAR